MEEPGSERLAAAPWRDPAARPYVSLRNLTKRFGDFTAVNDLSLDIYRKELFCLLGGSGCGKSTLLRMLAGFEVPTSGQIFIDGQDMAGIPPYRRPVNMMFQSYALFPHMTVQDNVAFGLRQEHRPAGEIRERVAAMLDLVKLGAFARRKPHQLSGGQRQRVALARSLIKEPKLLLLDEPLGALDRKLRESTQFELMNLQDKLGVTFVVVTHDQEEAMTLASRIGVMNHGQLVQVGTPSEIYEFPTSRFVADFIGAVNLFAGRIVDEDSHYVRIASDEAGCTLFIDHGVAAPPDAQLWVALRPEKIAISREPPADTAENCVQGRIEGIAYMGDMSVFNVRLGHGRLVQVTRPNLARRAEEPLAREDAVWLWWDPASAVVLTT